MSKYKMKTIKAGDSVRAGAKYKFLYRISDHEFLLYNIGIYNGCIFYLQNNAGNERIFTNAVTLIKWVRQEIKNKLSEAEVISHTMKLAAILYSVKL